MGGALFAVGDVHGHRDGLVRLLREAGLLDHGERWAGDDARLWILGDLTDRGPDGIGCIELVMRLERESEGRARCLLGNHDVMILEVALRPDVPVWHDGTTFREAWLLNGGSIDDLRALDEQHLAWLAGLPALALEDDWLLAHADTDLYLRYGSTVPAIVARVRRVLADGRETELAELMEVVSDRNAFYDPPRLARLLDRLGGRHVVHGHTPVAVITGRAPQDVTEPLVYADGLAVNADHCLFGGGPGFVVRLQPFGPSAG